MKKIYVKKFGLKEELLNFFHFTHILGTLSLIVKYIPLVNKLALSNIIIK